VHSQFPSGTNEFISLKLPMSRHILLVAHDVSSTNAWTVYRSVIAQSRSCWLHLLGIAMLSLFSMPLALLSPLPLKVAVDSVIGQQPVPVRCIRCFPSFLNP